MSYNIEEYEKILTREKSENTHLLIETGIQALLFHQIIYEDMPNIPKQCFDIFKRNRLFFERYFAIAGMVLNYDLRYQMLYLTPSGEQSPYASSQMRLKKEDSSIRIALRLLFEEGVRTGSLDEFSRVKSNYSSLENLYKNLSNKEAPTQRTIKEKYLKELHSRGALRIIDSKNSDDINFYILPGIRIYVSDEFIANVHDHSELD